MSIVLDAMGSDTHPDPELLAAIKAAHRFQEEIILVGNEPVILPKITAMNKDELPIRVVHAPYVVEMDEKAVESARQKPENSMAVGMQLVANGEARAFVTAGNTGGALFNAITTFRRIKGISRPALTTTLPTKTGRCAFLDTGANADCRPDFLLEFATMGSVYAKCVLGIENPRVGLLSNGEEDGKGNELVRQAHKLIRASRINFSGNVEPKDVYAGKVDVLVADGFSGNIFLKTSEAVGKFILSNLREQITASITRKLGYLLVKPAFTPLRKMMDPAEVGAAMLLGVNGYVFIGHGGSDDAALVNAIKLARLAVDNNLLDVLKESILEHNQG
jgi:glycerol-3-phosphate acyltransferase PlsX